MNFYQPLIDPSGQRAKHYNLQKQNVHSNTIMNSITNSLAELGTKIQTGAAEFAEKHELEKKVQPIKQKAGELTAKAGEAIASATKGKEKPEGEDGESPTEEGAERSAGDSEVPKKRNIVQDSITGLTANAKKGIAKLEEVPIGEILQKAKAKVFGADASSEAKGSESTAMVVGSESFDDMKSDVDSIASELEETSKETNKEKVQKLLVPLLSKLKGAQDKFTAMVDARKKKKEEEAAAAAEAGVEPKPNLLNTAETAVKKAFENAEKIARDVAKKAGIFDKNAEATTAEEIMEASLDTAEEVDTAPSGEPETKTAEEEDEKELI